MDDAHYHEIQQWLLKSQRDLEAAKVLFEHGLFDIVVYHCQQSAEKALKAYLVYQEVILTFPVKSENDDSMRVSSSLPFSISWI